MQNILLAIHIIIAILLIAVVLMQRSEGGGLGIGGSGGNVKATARSGLEAIGRFTWILAAGFVLTSLTLWIYSARNSGTSTLLDTINTLPQSSQPAEEVPAVPLPELPSENPTQTPAAPAPTE